MELVNNLSDQAVLEEVGQRIARHRIDAGLTQADLSREAGIGKRTLERVESGATAQFSTIIRILRVLELLPALEQILPQLEPGPIDILARKGKLRRRASSRRKDTENAGAWTWDEEA
jgi:transcriptional regulator with XRE-family HTH domain